MVNYETNLVVVSKGTESNAVTRQLYLEDNLMVMRGLASESVDLIYLDPPFNSNRNYKLGFRGPAGLRAQAHLPAFEDVWKWDEATESVFEDLMKREAGRPAADTVAALIGAIGRDPLTAYLVNMMPRLVEIVRLLKPTGSVYLHCDPTLSHYLKMVMDAVFGRENFRNEIVWCYRGGGVPRRDFARKHDVILRYSKTDRYVFHPQYTEYSDASKKLVNSRGGASIDDRVRDLERGAHMPDWWADINSLQTWSPERTGYPTQKPLRLLKRIVRASSNKGDLVMDPFSGCGTTLHAAEVLGRSWIGIDVEPLTLNILHDRFRHADFDVDFDVRGIPAMRASDHDEWMSMSDANPSKFGRAFMSQIGNCIPWHDRQASDGCIDGIISFSADKDRSSGVIMRISSERKIDTVDIRDLWTTVQGASSEGVVAGVLVSLEKPTAEVLDSACRYGEIEIGERKLRCLRVLTIDELLRLMPASRAGLPLPEAIAVE